LAPLTQVKDGIKFKNSLNFMKSLKSSNLYEIFPNTSNDNTCIFNSWLNKNFPFLKNIVIDMASGSESEPELKTSNNSINKDYLSVFLSHFPAGSSYKNLNHVVQNFQSKSFSYYNYKKEANTIIYNKQATPPQYDLKKINGIPIVLLAGKEDNFSCIDDVRWLESELGENVVYYKEFDEMGHFSFLMSKDIEWFHSTYEIILKYTKCSDISNDN
jgi:hypothetical protein